MAFQYSCFVSYCRGEGDLMRRFADDLTEALKDYIEPYLEEKVWRDERNLQPGDPF